MSASDEPRRAAEEAARGMAPILLVTLIGVGLLAAGSTDVVSRFINLTLQELALVVGAVLVPIYLATIVYWVRGVDAPSYRLAERVENLSIQLALGFAAWSSEGRAMFWIFAVGHATAIAATTARLGVDRVIVIGMPAVVAGAFALKGAFAAAFEAGVVALLVAFVFSVIRRSQQRIDELLRERERAALDATELRLLEERRRIARDLHDGVAAHLAALSTRLEGIGAAELPPTAELDRLRNRTRAGMSELRTVVWALRSPERSWAEILAHIRGRCEDLLPPQVPLSVESSDVAPDLSLDGEAALHLVRIVQEAVRNAVQHGRPSRVDVTCSCQERALEVVVTDDGKGLDNDVVNEPLEGGIANIRRRANDLGGVVRFEPADPRGTRVVVRVPLGTQRHR